MADLGALRDAVIGGQAKTAARLTQDALDEGVPAQTVLEQGLMAGLGVIGTRFMANQVFVPEVLVAARALKAGMAVLRPKLSETGARTVGTVVTGTVQGDLHDIGKGLVGMMLEGAGFKVIDLGTDVAPERFVAAVRSERPQLLGISALLTTTMMTMGNTIEALKAAGVRDQVKVMVGGAPVTQEFADRIGADGFAENAGAAVAKAKALLALR